MQCWLAFSLNFTPPLIYAMVTSRGKSVADSRRKPLSKPFGSLPGRRSVSRHPRCPWGKGSRVRGSASGFSVRADAPVSVPTGSQLPAKRSCRWVVKLALPPSLIVPQKATLSFQMFVCLFWQEEKGPNLSWGKRILRPSSHIVAPTGKAVPRFLPLSVN